MVITKHQVILVLLLLFAQKQLNFTRIIFYMQSDGIQNTDLIVSGKYIYIFFYMLKQKQNKTKTNTQKDCLQLGYFSSMNVTMLSITIYPTMILPNSLVGGLPVRNASLIDAFSSLSRSSHTLCPLFFRKTTTTATTKNTKMYGSMYQPLSQDMVVAAVNSFFLSQDPLLQYLQLCLDVKGIVICIRQP